MMTSIKKFAVYGLAATMLLTSSQGLQAGLIPWTYNAIFGPVGSTFGNRRGCCFPQTQVMRPVFVPGNSCSTCNYGPVYSAGYAPHYTSYSYGSAYGAFGCSTCVSGCDQNCPSGNCTSSYTPANGITPTPDNTVSPTPTQTFRSSEPTVNPNNNSAPSTFERNDGFEQPTRPNNNNGNSNGVPNPTNDDSAPPFNPFGGTNSTESMKVPAAPMVPVEKRQPAPLEPENNGSLRLPELRLEPAPVAIDTSNASWNRPVQITRSARSAHYEIPTVARHVPVHNSPFLPPLPAPVQMVSK